MNHSYHAQSSEIDKCAICARTSLDHTDSATCESCQKTYPCNITKLGNGRELLLCEACTEIELRLYKMKEARTPAQNRVSELSIFLIKELPVSDRQFHIKEITAIVDIEAKLKETGIDNPQYELAKIIEERIITLKKNLFELKQQEHEIQQSAIIDQKYLNNLVPKLREEERAQFKDYDISYKPTTVTPKATASKPRISASDKAMESAAKMMGITLDQYKAMMAKAVASVTGAACTCAEMPGMCKIHPKG